MHDWAQLISIHSSSNICDMGQELEGVRMCAGAWVSLPDRVYRECSLDDSTMTDILIQGATATARCMHSTSTSSPHIDRGAPPVVIGRSTSSFPQTQMDQGARERETTTSCAYYSYTITHIITLTTLYGRLHSCKTCFPSVMPIIRLI